MFFFKFILGFLKKVFFQLVQSGKAPIPNRTYLDDSLKNINSRLTSLILQEESTEKINEVIKEKTSIEIEKELGGQSQEPTFNLAELKREIERLNGRLVEINKEIQEIKLIPITDDFQSQNIALEVKFERVLKKINAVDSDIDSYYGLPKKLDIHFSEIDAFFKELNLVDRYRIREAKRVLEEESKQQKINKSIHQLSEAVQFRNLPQARKCIKNLKFTISNLRSTIKQEEYRKQLLTLERLVDEIAVEELHIRREKEEKERRKKEDLKRQFENEKKQKLQNLLIKKSNWQEFKRVLNENEIHQFYHFTDATNIKSIKQNKGLYSWYYCQGNNIEIPRPGGSNQSRQNDITNNKKDFVRLALNKEHPMLWVAEKENRITNPIWLEISIKVAFFIETEFSDVNAAAFKSYTPNIGGTLSHLQNIRFDIIKTAEIHDHLYISREERKFNQAEVLVKTWIPIEYITNINQF